MNDGLEQGVASLIDAYGKACIEWSSADVEDVQGLLDAMQAARTALIAAIRPVKAQGEATGAVSLTDKQIQDAVFAVLRRWNTDRAWDRYTRESGPYDVTSLRPEVLEIIRAVLAIAALPPVAGAAGTVPLSVWFGPMSESNGKMNWTAILHRGDMMDGFTIAWSEYHDRVRYDADRIRYLIGELSERPDILAYDPDMLSPAGTVPIEAGGGVGVASAETMSGDLSHWPKLAAQLEKDAKWIGGSTGLGTVAAGMRASARMIRALAAGVTVGAPTGILPQLARAVEASEAGHDPLCMAILRGKACTCGLDERTAGVKACDQPQGENHG